MAIIVCCVVGFAALCLIRLIVETGSPSLKDSIGADFVLAEIGRQRLDL